MKKKLLIFVTICLIASAVLIVFNLSQFKKYQVKKRNDSRKSDISLIISKISNYLENNNNNLPTSSNPDTGSFLPDLIFRNGVPSGGVSTSALENMDGYFDLNKKDPSGDPYRIGIYENQIVVYTNNFEEYKSGNIVYFETLKLKPTSIED